MSLKTRLRLIAGSSLAAASLSAVAFAGFAVAPTEALAANECSPVGIDPSANGATADSYTCSATPYATGITYSSAGDLTVTKTNTTPTTVTANGVNLTGNGPDSVTWDSTAGSVTGGAGTNGAVIDVSSVSGAINVTTAAVGGTQVGTTFGIKATSTGGGDITISRAAGAVSNNAVGGQAAILADTNGGDISITTAGGFTTGRLRGIVAQTSGAGTISLSAGSTVTISAIDGVAAIDTISGSGPTTILINNVNGGAGAAIRSVSGGTVSVQQMGSFTTVSGRVDFSGVAGGVTWDGPNGDWAATGASVFSGAADTVSVGFGSIADGASIDFGGGADAVSLGRFTINGNVALGAGADQLNITGESTVSGGLIDFGADNDMLAVSGALTLSGDALDFGSGADTVELGGALFASGVATISNLEAFDSAGSIFLSASFDNATTDGVPNDLLRMTSGVFTGSGDSRIVIDANLGTHGSQIGCATATEADCVDFTGATTAGSTLITVQDVSFSINGGTIGAPVTIIEGSTAAEHFTLAPDSTFYVETAAGGIIRKPVVAYRLLYDAANQRHMLVGVPSDEVFEVGTFAASAQETWRATMGSWLTRQADMRATPGGFTDSNGVWARIGAQTSEREAAASYGVEGLTIDYDLTQKQKIAHLVFGADMMRAESADSAALLGVMGGFVRSDVEFEATPTEAVTSGFMGGVYSSYISGPLFIDGVLSVNALHVKADAPAMGLGLDVPMTFDLVSLGGQVEAGWRLGMGSVFIEPLVGASYVSTKIDDTDVPGGSGEFAFEDAKSFRIGGGARVGMDSELMGMASSLSLTGRYWNELEGENSATITTASGSSALLLDDFAGSFSEVVASVNLYSGDGGVSGFVNLGGKFGEDYQAVDGSVGVRVRW